MLEPLKHFLKNKTIILASTSPRRKEILEKNLGLNINVSSSSFPEDLNKSDFKSPADYAVATSQHKVIDVAKKLGDQDWFLIIGADTVVEMNNKIYEKPLNREDALDMLKTFNDKKLHQVTTGVTLAKKDDANDIKYHSFHDTTDVLFGDIDDEIFQAYVDTNEAMDKSGAYSLLGVGSTFVKSINGDFYNVIGFPVYKFSVELKKFLNVN